MIAVITGGSKGIGLAIAKKFLKHDIEVIICGRNLESLHSAKKELELASHGATTHIFQVDMSKKAEVLAFGQLLLRQFGNIDILVNNAGIFLPGEIHQEGDGLLESQIETNLYSAYHMTRCLVPQMIENKSGYIINMCSIASKIAYPNGGSYSISKFALYGFSKVLREELKDKGIKVTAILPGATWSASWEGVDLPESRLMQAEDIAKVVYTVIELSPSADMEEVILRPLLGDL